MADITNDSIRVTERIRKFLWKFPKSSPKEVCRTLNLDYKKYRNMVTVEKCNLKKWLGTKVQGRLPKKPLLSAHRVEWSFEQPLDMIALSVLSAEAGKRRPRLSDPRPVDEWYVVPNRNNMREFHNEFVTVRVFPKSGTVRVLAALDMDFEVFRRHVKIAFLKGGLSEEQAELKSRLLIPSEKHRTFRVGPVTPFKIDFYKDPLGLTLKADGSHPEHIEAVEGWPSWIKPQLYAIHEQTDAIKQLTEQIRVHLSVMQGIDKSTKQSVEATERLVSVVEKLYRLIARLETKPESMKASKEEKLKPFSLNEWLKEIHDRYKVT